MIHGDQLYNAINAGVIEERNKLFERNVAKNLNLIQKWGGIQKILENFSGKHVIVAGAGPSLDECIPVLKKYQFRDELLIVATDMSLGPLAKQGIQPSYVFSCETAVVDFFSTIDTRDMHLVAFSCVSHSNVRKWCGPISFYNWMLRSGEYEELWKRAGENLGYVATASIVTTQAIALALGLDIKSLMLVGNDMGFFDRFYARGTIALEKTFNSTDRFAPGQTFEMNKARARREYKISRGGRDFYTNHQFLAAKMWLEELFEKTKMPVYDCSAPGCSEKHVHKVSLSEYFNIIHIVRKRKRVRL